MPTASTFMPSVQVSDFEDICLLIRHDRLICDFCSLGQRFACGFLQIPPRDGHPCRSANSSPCRACRGLAPPSACALPGAQTKKDRPRAVPSDHFMNANESNSVYLTYIFIYQVFLILQSGLKGISDLPPQYKRRWGSTIFLLSG